MEGIGLWVQQLRQQSRYSTEVRRRQRKKNVRADRRTKGYVQGPASIAERTQEAVETPAKNHDKKKLDEPYQPIRPFPELGDILPFKSKNYKVPVSLEFKLFQMCPVICLFDTGAGPNLKRVNIQDQSCLNNIRQSDMLEFRSASEIRPVVSGTITIHLRMGQ